jgi:hypothetical protein
MPTPAELLGITGPNAIWKLQYGLPGVSGIKEVSASALATFELLPYFAATVDGWVQVRVPVNAGTTSGSTYPRDELRQMKPGGTTEASWDSKKTDCWFEYELKVTHLPPNKPQMCVLQLHSDKDDLLEVIYQRNTAGGYEFTQRVDGSSKGQPLVAHALNTGCVLALGLVKGVPTIYRDGKAILTTSKMPQSKKTYAKLLNYLQSNSKTDKVPEYGELLARNVRTGAGAYPGPRVTPVPTPVPDPTPVPVPDPTPVPTPVPVPSSSDVVFVIRHGEGGSNAHTLDATGQKRAAAIAELLTATPLREGLSRPDRIYASEGLTASLRPFQTVKPLADKLSEVEITKFAAADYAKAGKEIVGLHGVTLVAWAHTELPGLCKVFGVKTPSSWPDERFDVIWIFRRTSTGWSFSQMPELLLPGDRSSVL